MLKIKLSKSCFQILFCLIVALIFCYPFVNGSILLGPDTAFHINRIESLSVALQNNDFFPKIFYHQNFYFGYGSPLFYSVFFLYFPAWLRTLDFGVIDTYRLFLFTCAFFASITMYSCAQLLIGKKKNIYVCLTVLFYIWNCFYISDFYKRGAVGETLAFIFLPLVIMGMVYSLQPKFKKHYVLLFGFCGLLLSHNITFVITVVIYAFFLLFNYQILLQNKKRLLTIVILGITGILLTCFFTFPMLEQMSSETYRISDYFGTTSLQDLSMPLVDLFDFRTDSSNYLCDSVGPFLLFLPPLLLLVRRKNKSKAINFLTISGYIMVLMTTQLFPWQFFEFLSFLQFPTRLLVPANAFLALGAGYAIANVPLRKDIKALFNEIVIVSVFLVGIYQLFGVLTSPGLFTHTTTSDEMRNDVQFLNRSEWYNLLELSTPDYLPADTNINYRDYQSKIVSNNEEVARGPITYEEYNNFIFTYGYVKEDAYYIMPLTYYKGYVVDIYEGDTLLESVDATMDTETGLVKFEPTPYVSDSNEIIFKIYYKGTQLQFITERLSLFTLILYTLFIVLETAYSLYIHLKTTKSKKAIT